MTWSHDPDRVEELRGRAGAALDDLASFRTSDPAAAHAVQVAKLTAHTLRSFWLPTLDDLLAGRARHDDRDRPTDDSAA